MKGGEEFDAGNQLAPGGVDTDDLGWGFGVDVPDGDQLSPRETESETPGGDGVEHEVNLLVVLEVRWNGVVVDRDEVPDHRVGFKTSADQGNDLVSPFRGVRVGEVA